MINDSYTSTGIPLSAEAKPSSVSCNSVDNLFSITASKTYNVDRTINSNNDVKKKKYKTPRFAHFAIIMMLLLFSIALNSKLSKLKDDSARDLTSVVFKTVTEEVVASQPEGSDVIKEQRWSDVKLAIYMTTHLSETHISFLPCWNDAIRRMKIFQYADLILYASSYPNTTVLQYLPFRNVTIKLYNNSGYQSGAIQAMIDPFVDETDQWFGNYDWVIRLNPDVLIRSDTWLIQTMLNTSIDAIVHDCRNRKLYPPNSSDNKKIPPKFHTDFTAFRPQAIDRNLFLTQIDKENAEAHITNALGNIYNSSRFAYVKGGRNSKLGICRIEGRQSPIVHVHEIHKFCPFYYNATNATVYR